MTPKYDKDMIEILFKVTFLVKNINVNIRFITKFDNKNNDNNNNNNTFI